ncbi:hypothetical protein B7P43_G07285 [Cryptotermes secundus]|uniref:Uncharacterized protein n=1 Tax=Cryptotermes secundus TaxID=105785 RepID=A0A2J7QN04_9NEOP|nr:hypothetical protein B7P43_G07285 [Cryptotermes secundus]
MRRKKKRKKKKREKTKHKHRHRLGTQTLYNVKKCVLSFKHVSYQDIVVNRGLRLDFCVT